VLFLTCPVHSSLSLLLYCVFLTNKDDDDDDDDDDDERAPGSGRPRTTRTAENVDGVQSQENQP